MLVITEPPQRIDLNKCPYSGLCDAEAKEEVNVLKPSKAGTPIQWKTVNAKGNLLCRLTLVHSILSIKTEEMREARVLFPLDNSANEAGFFQCGRKNETYELKLVNLTSNFQRGSYLLKFEWTIGTNSFVTCSDIMIVNEQEQCEDGNPCCEGLISTYIQGTSYVGE
eukprot:TRINITY_DN136_c0_g2_i1.p1 TRINITY_DN136_c0_g2~~TRINITY_DN136_c0_g2_i1.p1  ORF type:complete len:167 (-),score=2.49 TRINITY_DN136_c0_g2_i1:90-590(-)